MTEQLCLASKAHFESLSRWRLLPLYHYPQNHKWSASSSSIQWVFTTLWCIIALILAILFLCVGIYKSVAGAVGAYYMLSLGFGAVIPAATIRFRFTGVFPMLLIANTPQLLLCLLYFSYNSLYTAMLLAHEWSGYAKERKSLRVTSPSGKQRSTYRLQLPYRYGIPLLCVSSLLHWLVSQSIFLVILDAYRTTGIQTAEGEVITCGYSPVAILITILAGALVVIAGVANGRRRYKAGIPLAGSCSAAISAACHPPPGDVAPSTKAVLWGVCESMDGKWDTKVSLPWGKESDPRKTAGTTATTMTTTGRITLHIGHCSFTSLAAEEPIEGDLYAGSETSLNRFGKTD